jgi:hypothetical protein
MVAWARMSCPQCTARRSWQVQYAGCCRCYVCKCVLFTDAAPAPPPCAAILGSVGVLLLAAALQWAVLRARRSTHTLMGAVKAPGVGPSTTLLVTDIQVCCSYPPPHCSTHLTASTTPLTDYGIALMTVPAGACVVHVAGAVAGYQHASSGACSYGHALLCMHCLGRTA